MNRTTTIVLVLVFAALAVYVLLVQVPKDKATAEATGTPAALNYLWSISVDKVTGLRVVDHVRQLEVALAKDAGGAWTITAPTAQLADQARVGTAVGGLSALALNSTVTTTSDLAAFGVLSPTHTIEVSLADGTKLKASIGDKTPTGADYYVLRDGDTHVVTVSTFGIEALTGLIDKPPVVAPTGTPTAGAGTSQPLPTGAGSATPTGSATATTATGTAPAATATQTGATATPTAAALFTATAAASVTP